jgi:hypothetical protein
VRHEDGIVEGAVPLVALALTASPALAAPTNAIENARPIVSRNVGDVPAPNGQGILNNIDNLPVAAFNSTTRNPVCSEYTGGPPA